MYSGNELRQMFLDFYASKGHIIVPSASLIPKDDPTLLLTVAGMVPFKPYFLRKVEPPFPRATTAQKCVRTPDLEQVGRTARHHTFFEMLGNFSFGDYFKEGAITWAWEFLAEVLKLSRDRLWITIYPGDEEALALWVNKAGVARERIILDESNFWAAGPTGPCGPCSEIYYDQGEERSCGPECAMGCECDRFLEIWNLVFMQYNRDEAGTLSPLPYKNIDTGMGLERIASVLQGVESNFDTDLLMPLIRRTAALAGVTYKSSPKHDVSLKVVADHVRAVTFMLADGIRPDNEGRGYVLRRILRRAVRHGKLLGIKDAFLTNVVDVVINDYGQAYPELKENHEFIMNHLQLEERNFQSTLDQGLNILNQFVERLGATKMLAGQEAFELFATYGFPLEMTEEILAEQGLSVDKAAFDLAMAEHREKAKQTFAHGAGVDKVAQATLTELAKRFGTTKFLGYDELRAEGKVLALVADGQEVAQAQAGQQVSVILDATPFYAESGGQAGDPGRIIWSGGEVMVNDTHKISGSLFVHKGKLITGSISGGQAVTALVDAEQRLASARNHSATHLLHQALKHVLGRHVNQAGSLVEPERLRFDFSHFSALTPEQLDEVETIVNREILANMPVQSVETSMDQAKVLGATALFGEKYGDVVRMVSMGDFSRELCGGTHVHSTGEIGLFRIIAEGGIGAGLRRIEAVTGMVAVKLIKAESLYLAEIGGLLKVSKLQASAKVEQLLNSLKEKDREIQQLQQKMARNEVGALLETVREVAGVKVLSARVQAPDMDALRSMCDFLRDKLGSGVIVLGSAPEGKVNLVASVSKDLIGKLHAGNIIKEVAKITGGGGGGRPDMAQAGGKDPAKLDAALQEVVALVNFSLQ
ncbi:MAG: alanine--tRNA ligase [Peptococcaceae bacterium]|nr:alanine--tRNA ligase [Peptococcaceae bacterium]